MRSESNLSPFELGILDRPSIDYFFKQQPPNIQNYFDVARNLIASSHFTKAECWKYEEETRFQYVDSLNDKSSAGTSISFSPNDIQDIVFGANCEKDFKDLIIKNISDPIWEHVKIWQAELNHASRKIKLTPLEEILAREKPILNHLIERNYDDSIYDDLAKFGHQELADWFSKHTRD